VLLRAYSEFMEMPGLRLTLAQASRLFGAGLEQCVSALDLLVDVQFLRRTGDSYVRAADGHDPGAVLAMMRAPGAPILDAGREAS
jgi:hypothetical protein